MTNPSDKISDPAPRSRRRLIANCVLLLMNIVICVYFLRLDSLILFLPFAALALRNAYIVYTEVQGK